MIPNCPFCGSSNRVERRNEPADSHVISFGLPDYFRFGKWFYYSCDACFDRNIKSRLGANFVFAIVDKVTYLYSSHKEKWIPIGKEHKEVVLFT